MELADAMYDATSKKSSIGLKKVDGSDINRKDNFVIDDEHSVKFTDIDSTNAKSTGPQTTVYPLSFPLQYNH